MRSESEEPMSEEQETSPPGMWDEHVYKILSASALLLLGTGTVVYHFLEGWTWVDSLYFSVVAVTTVGFGDLAPSTDPSKLFTVGYVLVGIGIITTYLNARLQQRGRKRIQRST